MTRHAKEEQLDVPKRLGELEANQKLLRQAVRALAHRVRELERGNENEAGEEEGEDHG